jgi:hypothetical protein
MMRVPARNRWVTTAIVGSVGPAEKEKGTATQILNVQRDWSVPTRSDRNMDLPGTSMYVYRERRRSAPSFSERMTIVEFAVPATKEKGTAIATMIVQKILFVSVM